MENDWSQQHSHATQSHGMNRGSDGSTSDYHTTPTARAHPESDIDDSNKLGKKLLHIKDILDSYRASAKLDLGDKEGNQLQLRLLNQAFDTFDALLDVPNHGQHCVYVESSIPGHRKSSMNGWVRRDTDAKDGGSGGLEYDYAADMKKLDQAEYIRRTLKDVVDSVDVHSKSQINLLSSMTCILKEVLSFIE